MGIVSSNAPPGKVRALGGDDGHPKKSADDPFRWFDLSPEVIRLVVMIDVRYPLSLRNVEDLLLERGIDICHEMVRLWETRFGPGQPEVLSELRARWTEWDLSQRTSSGPTAIDAAQTGRTDDRTRQIFKSIQNHPCGAGAIHR